MPDPTSRIRFSSAPPKKAWIILCKTGPIRSGWSCQVVAKRVWSGSKPGCKTHRVRFCQNATDPLPVSHFQTRLRSFTDGPDRTAQNQPGSDLVRADCARFWPNGSGPETIKPACQNHRVRFWPTFPSRSGSDANRIRHVYWLPHHCVSRSILCF